MHSLHLDRHDAHIRWFDLGDGPPVLWIAGLSFPTAINFMPVIAHGGLGDFRNLFVDYLGTGASDVPRDFGWSLDENADSFVAILDHLGLDRLPVIGFSQGGTVAIRMAEMHPERVTRIVVCEGNIRPGGGSASRAIAAHPNKTWASEGWPDLRDQLAAQARQGDSFADLLLAGYGQSDPDALHAAAKSLVDLPEDFEQRFLDLALPRHFIMGEKSLPERYTDWPPDTPPPEHLRAAGIEVHVVTGSGHLMTHENTDGFVAAVRAALTSDA